MCRREGGVSESIFTHFEIRNSIGKDIIVVSILILQESQMRLNLT